VFFIVDEVICGFGCMGKMFGFEMYLFKFDIMVMVKVLFAVYLLIFVIVIFEVIY